MRAKNFEKILKLNFQGTRTVFESRIQEQAITKSRFWGKDIGQILLKVRDLGLISWTAL